MQVIDPLLIPGKFILVAIDRCNIFRRRQNTQDDCFAQGHFRCNMTFKKFLGHITVIIKVAHIGGCQAQQFGIGAKFQQVRHTFTPIFRAGTMKFIQDYIGRMLRCYLCQLIFCAAHQFCVGIKSNVCKR